MTTKQLIEKLQSMPPDAEVMHLWDGELRTTIEHVWVSRGGDVVTADCKEVAYSDCDRPVGAPTSEQDPYWQTADEPEDEK